MQTRVFLKDEYEILHWYPGPLLLAEISYINTHYLGLDLLIGGATGFLCPEHKP